MNAKHLKQGFVPILLFLALSSIVLSKAKLRHLAQERASVRFINQIRTTMDGLFGLDAAQVFSRLGYPTEERRILGKTFVVWHREGPEVTEMNFTTLTNTWSNVTTTATSDSTTNAYTSGTSSGTWQSNTDATDRWGRQVPIVAGWNIRTSGSYSGSSESRTSSNTTSRSRSETSIRGGATSFGKGKAVKYKIQCTITLEVGEQNRIRGWEFARDSALDYCVAMLNIEPSFAQLVEEEIVNLKEEEAQRKAAHRAGLIYVGIEGCNPKALPAQRPPGTKIAIFPFGSDSSCLGQNRPTQEKLASTLRTIVQSNGLLKLGYFYYDKAPGDPLQSNIVDQLWMGDMSARPNTALVLRLGQELDVDAVLMSWRPAAGVGYCTNRMPPYPIDLYLIDVKSQCMLSIDGDETYVKGITEQLFSYFLSRVSARSTASANKR